MVTASELASTLNIDWFDYQAEAFERFDANRLKRICLFFRTGAGKTLTSLGCLRLEGCTQALVIAPPRIHDQWHTAATDVGIDIETISDIRSSIVMPDAVNQSTYNGNNFNIDQVNNLTDNDHLSDPSVSYDGSGVDGCGRCCASPDAAGDFSMMAAATPSSGEAASSPMARSSVLKRP